MAPKSVKEHRLIVLATGGTGGHLFPAQALAEELQRRHYEVHLLTDSRVRDHGAKFPAAHVYDIPSATLTMTEPAKLPGRLFRPPRGCACPPSCTSRTPSSAGQTGHWRNGQPSSPPPSRPLQTCRPRSLPR